MRRKESDLSLESTATVNLINAFTMQLKSKKAYSEHHKLQVATS